jgi:flagellar protein FliS
MNPYFEQTILNADPTELIKMVYQRAISCVRDAREHLQHKRIAERSAAIMRAYAALTELLAALRSDIAPDLAERLQNLYFYMQRRLVDANFQQADQPLEEVLGLLVTLAAAWAGVVAELAPAEAAPEERTEEGLDTRRWRQAGPEGVARIGMSA